MKPPNSGVAAPGRMSCRRCWTCWLLQRCDDGPPRASHRGPRSGDRDARVDGEPSSDIETVSYYLIVATAGHDTTSATISGGLHALSRIPTSAGACATTSS